LKKGKKGEKTRLREGGKQGKKNPKKKGPHRKKSYEKKLRTPFKL